MYRLTVLENGLRVATEQIPGARSTSIGILVDASPQHDPFGKEGLAHFTEHGLFQGTTGRDTKAISSMIDEAGGQLGAFTSRDYTCYYAHIMEDYSPFAWELLGDILLNSTFPEAAMSRERDVILQELALQNDDHASRLHDTLKQRIWGDHPLGRPVAGSIDSVRDLTRDDVIRFVNRRYTPDTMILAAAGAARHEHIVEQAHDTFWRLVGTASTSSSSFCDFHSTVHYEHREVGQSYFSIAIPAVTYADHRRYTIHVLNSIIGSGLSSRLYRQLREELGLVYFVNSQYYAYRNAGVILIEGVTSPENIDLVVQTIILELVAIAEDGIGEDELWKTKMQMKGQQLLTADSLSTRMSRLLTQDFYFHRFLTEDEILDAISQVKGQDVQDEASRILSQKSMAIGVVGPDEQLQGKTKLIDILIHSGFRESLETLV